MPRGRLRIKPSELTVTGSWPFEPGTRAIDAELAVVSTSLETVRALVFNKVANLVAYRPQIGLFFVTGP